MTYALVCGEQRIEVDASICEMSTERVHWKKFVTEAREGAPSLLVRRHAALEGTSIDAPLGKCTFVHQGTTLDVAVDDGPFRGELILRLAWYLVGTAQGAVLIHANALTDGSRALVAAGKSGDGKSTLARLAQGAGLQLLTDEVVMLFPDGRVSGTPFRSDFDNVGRPGLARARYFFALEKAQAKSEQDAQDDEKETIDLLMADADEEETMVRDFLKQWQAGMGKSKAKRAAGD